MEYRIQYTKHNTVMDLVAKQKCLFKPQKSLSQRALGMSRLNLQCQRPYHY